MEASSPTEFAAAVRSHCFPRFDFDPEAITLARRALAETGMLVVGEPHGVRETPSVLYALASLLGTRAVAFEWSYEEMDEVVQRFVRDGSFDFERLWSLPATAEFFCGDGRITAGHFALLQRLRHEGCLDQVVVFDRLDAGPERIEWEARELEMAQRLLSEWDGRCPLLVLTGAFHAQLDAPEGETMANVLARRKPGLRPAVLDYGRGEGWSRGQLYDLPCSLPPAPIVLRPPMASAAVVPGF